MIYLVAGIVVSVVSMVYVKSSSENLFWCLLGFGIGVYLILKGRKKLGFIKKK
ncbi:MAG: hypothetical protein GY870_08740 [archaeon]|nr:hypothetical protein [archaeon]